MSRDTSDTVSNDWSDQARGGARVRNETYRTSWKSGDAMPASGVERQTTGDASAGELAGTAVLARKIDAQIAQSSCARPPSWRSLGAPDWPPDESETAADGLLKSSG
jgi:hypothetical protein